MRHNVVFGINLFWDGPARSKEEREERVKVQKKFDLMADVMKVQIEGRVSELVKSYERLKKEGKMIIGKGR